MEASLRNLRSILQSLHANPTTAEASSTSSSHPSNISSLSGSKVDNNDVDALHKLLSVALDAESGLHELDSLFFESFDGNKENEEQQSALLLTEATDALMSMLAVPNALLRKMRLFAATATVSQLTVNLQQVCYNIVCIAVDLLRQFHSIDNTLLLNNGHVNSLMDQITLLCECCEGWSSNVLYPMIILFNDISQEWEMERTVLCYEYYNRDSLNLSAKETLRLIRILPEETTENGSGSHIGRFVSHLLVHFAHRTLFECGYTSYGECCPSLFRVWARGTNEHLSRRLSEEDVGMVLTSVSQFQIDAIQDSLRLMERIGLEDTVLGSSLEKRGGEGRDVIALVQDCLRNVGAAVSITEVMEKLGMEYDPEICVIFHPMMSSLASFVGTCLQEVLSPFGQVGHVLSHTADDLLVRICRTGLGYDFLTNRNDGREDVLAVALLRAMSCGWIGSRNKDRGNFLLDIVATLSNEEDRIDDYDPVAKRQCYFKSLYDRMDRSIVDTTTDGTKHTRQTMTDLMMLCMTFNQSILCEGMDPSSVDQASCLASAFMSRKEQGNAKQQQQQQQALDPLNPWHTLNMFTLKDLTKRLEESQDDDDGVIASYSSAVPICLDTRAGLL